MLLQFSTLRFVCFKFSKLFTSVFEIKWLVKTILRWKLTEVAGIRNSLLLWVTNLVYHAYSNRQNWNFDFLILCLGKECWNIRILLYLFFCWCYTLGPFLKHLFVQIFSDIVGYWCAYFCFVYRSYILVFDLFGYFFILHFNKTFSLIYMNQTMMGICKLLLHHVRIIYTFLARG